MRSFQIDRRASLLWGVILAILWITQTGEAAVPVQGDQVPPSDSAASRAVSTMPDLIVPAPTGTNRVTAAAAFHPANAAPGESITLVVKVRIAPGHWIYAMDDSGSRNVPTRVRFGSEVPLRLTEPWHSPQPKVKSDGSKIYAGETALEGRCKIERGATEGTRTLPISLNYQVCNEALCWPETTITLEPVLKVLSSP